MLDADGGFLGIYRKHHVPTYRTGNYGPRRLTTRTMMNAPLSACQRNGTATGGRST